jgi:SAM-dependent methyltransferase
VTDDVHAIPAPPVPIGAVIDAKTAEAGAHEWSLVELFEMGEAAASLIAAHNVGLIDALLAGADSPEGYARTLGLDGRATRLVLNVLLTYGAVELADEQFRASAALRQVHREHPGGVSIDLVLLGHETAFLRTGAPKVRMDGSARERDTSFAQLSSGLANLFGPASTELSRRVRRELLAGQDDDGCCSGPCCRILDLGAGSGIWSMALLEEVPGSHLTAVDLPRVAEQLRRGLSARGLARRADVVAGSYFRVSLPRRHFDLVILGNVLHLEPVARARRLIGIAADAVRPGGVLVVIDALAEEPYETNRRRAMYALSLALRTVDGRTYSAREITGWLADAGLVDVQRFPITGAPSHIDFLSARRGAPERSSHATTRPGNEVTSDG